ncbi:MAG: succinate dehydrogenase/fumarate reductase iron-sulfur subunit [Nitrososphaerota archaeon]
MEARGKKVLIRIYRPQIKKFLDAEVEVTKGTTILDILKYVKKNIDGSLAFRYQCEMGSCGSCGVVVNGKPVLACQTEVLSLKKNKIIIRPLYNFPVIKDLVVDQEEFMFKKYYKIQPLLKINCEFDELISPRGEFIIPPKVQEKISVYARCINCGLCMAACPTVSFNDEFLGPYVLLSMYRYYLDPRIGMKESLIEKTVGNGKGIISCHYIRSCSRVCPENIEVAECIQKLKKEYFKNVLLITRYEKPEINIRKFLSSPTSKILQ